MATRSSETSPPPAGLPHAQDDLGAEPLQGGLQRVDALPEDARDLDGDGVPPVIAEEPRRTLCRQPGRIGRFSPEGLEAGQQDHVLTLGQAPQ